MIKKKSHRVAVTAIAPVMSTTATNVIPTPPSNSGVARSPSPTIEAGIHARIASGIAAFADSAAPAEYAPINGLITTHPIKNGSIVNPHPIGAVERYSIPL